jgi:hypothetical protein
MILIFVEDALEKELIYLVLLRQDKIIFKIEDFNVGFIYILYLNKKDFFKFFNICFIIFYFYIGCHFL